MGTAAVLPNPLSCSTPSTNMGPLSQTNIGSSQVRKSRNTEKPKRTQSTRASPRGDRRRESLSPTTSSSGNASPSSASTSPATSFFSSTNAVPILNKSTSQESRYSYATDNTSTGSVFRSMIHEGDMPRSTTSILDELWTSASNTSPAVEKQFPKQKEAGAKSPRSSPKLTIGGHLVSSVEHEERESPREERDLRRTVTDKVEVGQKRFADNITRLVSVRGQTQTSRQGSLESGFAFGVSRPRARHSTNAVPKTPPPTKQKSNGFPRAMKESRYIFNTLGATKMNLKIEKNQSSADVAKSTLRNDEKLDNSGSLDRLIVTELQPTIRGQQKCRLHLES